MRYIFLFFFAFLINTSVYSSPAECTEFTGYKICSCKNRPEPVLDGENCITIPIPPDKEIQPQCDTNYDAYNINGGVRCYKKCSPPFQRDYSEDNVPLNSCGVVCGPKHDYHWGYDYDLESCTYTCMFNEEMVGGTCLQRCEFPMIRDLLTKNCVYPKDPVEPEIPKEECEKDTVSAVECLRISVKNALDKLKTNFNEGFEELNKLLNQILDKESDPANPTDPPNPTDPKPDEDLDLDELNANTPVEELNPQNLSDSIFQSRTSCPADNDITIWGHVYKFSYQRICDPLEIIGFLFMTLAYAFAAYIIVRKT